MKSFALISAVAAVTKLSDLRGQLRNAVANDEEFLQLHGKVHVK